MDTDLPTLSKYPVVIDEDDEMDKDSQSQGYIDDEDTGDELDEDTEHELNSVAFGTKRSFFSATIESEASTASIEIAEKFSRFKRHYKGSMDAPDFQMMAKVEDATMQMMEISAADMLLQLDRNTSRLKPTVKANHPLVVTWFESWIRNPEDMETNIDDAGCDKRDHSDWKAEMVKDYAAGSSTNPRFLWDPILQEYKDTVIAAHIFPQSCGNRAFSIIFGDKGTTNGVYDPRNGIFLDQNIKERFDKGYLAIVPNVDFKDPKQVEQWLAHRPREYKVQVFRPDAEEMCNEYIDLHGKIPYTSLDGRVLEFKSDFRPAARFLAYHYLYCLVRLCYCTGTRGRDLLDRVGGQIWAKPAKHMKRALLIPMLQQMGLENDERIFVTPLRLADRDESDVDDDDDEYVCCCHSVAALQAVNNTITQDVRE